MSRSAARIVYEFSGFRLDPQLRLLLTGADDRPVPLTSKVLDTLLYFVERHGELLDKATLIKAIWPNLVVEENNLNQSISALRRALGERPGEHRFIVTEPGRGYRFVADVTTRTVEQTNGATAARTNPASPTRSSIAVLPFVNLTGDPGREYFSDGLAEELIHTLARVPGLRVPARTSSFAYKGRSIDVRQIARDLDVEVVLEGSMRSAGERIRVTTQLINGESGYQLWSQHYDRRFEDLFELQDDLATAIVQALSRHLRVELPPAVKETAPTRDLEAYDLYLQARSLVNRISLENFRTARELLRRSIERDPRFAEAFATLSRAHLNWFGSDMSFDADRLQEAEDAARQALSRDGNLAEARAVLAQVAAFRADWAGAEREYEFALALDTGEPTLHGAHTLFLFHVGHIRKALAEAREADRLAPGLASVSMHFSIIYSVLGLDTEAVRYADKAVNLGASPDYRTLQIIWSHVAYRRGDTAEAGTHMVRVLPADVRESGGADAVRLIYAALADPNRKPAAIVALRNLQAGIKEWNSGITIMLMMHWYTMLGELDSAYDVANAALDGLRRSGTVGGAVWTGLWIPEMRPFRQDPRFQAFAEGLHLMEYWQKYGPPDVCELRDGTLICN